MGYEWDIPSGKLTVCDIEHGQLKCVDLPIANDGDVPVRYVSLPEGHDYYEVYG